MTNSFSDFLPRLEAARKHLHAHPEVSEFEFETAEFIKNYLEQNTTCDNIIPVAKTGVLAVFEGSEPGETTLLRADTDALPIQEINEFAHKSTNPGVSHKCGHDGHTVMMLGVAHALSAHPPAKGRVLLLFQPAEENGMGAPGVIADPEFQKFGIDRVFALHNLPGHPKGEILTRNGVFNANVTSMIITLQGKTSHAAEPEHGINPAAAIAEITLAIDKLNNNYPEQDDFFNIVPVYATLGEKAYGISAGYGELHLTYRAWNGTLVNQQWNSIEALAGEISEKHGLKLAITRTQDFNESRNDASCVDIVRQAAQNGSLGQSELPAPMKWGEDFGLFTQTWPGAMFGLGSGVDTPALHNPDYDFPDDITENGIRIFEQVVRLLN